MEYVSADGKRKYIVLDGSATALTIRKSRLVDPVYAPGKLAVDPSQIKKSRPLPSSPEYDPSKHMPRTNAAQPTVHNVGDESMPVVKFNAVYHFVGSDGMLRHGVVIGQSATHALLATRDGRFTAPKAKLSPGIHPDAEKG
jgi:hypothetical protein